MVSPRFFGFARHHLSVELFLIEPLQECFSQQIRKVRVLRHHKLAAAGGALRRRDPAPAEAVGGDGVLGGVRLALELGKRTLLFHC